MPRVTAICPRKRKTFYFAWSLSRRGSPSELPQLGRNRNSQARVCSASCPQFATDAGMQRYGLQLRKKPAASSSSRPPPPARPLAAFADDSDDDVEADILRQSSKKRALEKVSSHPDPMPSVARALILLPAPPHCPTQPPPVAAAALSLRPLSLSAAPPRGCLPLLSCRVVPLLPASVGCRADPSSSGQSLILEEPSRACWSSSLLPDSRGCTGAAPGFAACVGSARAGHKQICILLCCYASLFVFYVLN